ncbi:MAG: copper chaperone PCu(A)C [Gammaproteobacteria bacterium]|nr:copper chaperone PCu(A)C [Gammaproteobacteria bacterium]
MRHPFTSFAAILLLVFTASIVQAHHLVVKNIWIPEAPPVTKVMAAFMVFQNRSDKAVNIVEVSSPDFTHVEMHLSKIVDGVAKMLPQKQLSIPANSQLVLKPGSYHLMLYNPKKALKSGDTASLTITMSDGNQFTTKAIVKKSAMKMMDHSNH